MDRLYIIVRFYLSRESDVDILVNILIGVAGFACISFALASHILGSGYAANSPPISFYVATILVGIIVGLIGLALGGITAHLIAN